jgi:magnesium chelatase subunit I
VRLANVADLDQRQAIVRARLQFEADPVAFRAQHAAGQAALAERLAAARARVQEPAALPWSDAVLQAAGALCVQAQVDGLRADLVLLRAARAWAAWQGDDEVTPAHVQAVAELALVHRRKPGVAPPAPAPATAPSPSPVAEPPRPAADRAPPRQAQPEPDWGAMPPEPTGTLRLAVPELLPAHARAAAKKA